MQMNAGFQSWCGRFIFFHVSSCRSGFNAFSDSTEIDATQMKKDVYRMKLLSRTWHQRDVIELLEVVCLGLCY